VIPACDIVLRRARAGDAGAIGQLTRAAYAPWAALIGREPLPMGFDHGAMIRDHLVDGLWRGGALLAVIEMIVRESDLLIENIAVAPTEQGTGLGGRLLGHAETTARSLGRHVVRLYTNSLFASNIALYRRRGYHTERQQTVANGIVVHMMRNLDEERSP